MFEQIKRKVVAGCSLGDFMSKIHQARLLEICLAINAASTERIQINNLPTGNALKQLRQAFHETLGQHHKSACMLQRRDHLLIAELLESNGIKAKPGVATPECLLPDVILPKHNVVIEVDSPMRSCITANVPVVKTRGRRMLTRMLLKKAGYKVVVIKSTDWEW